MMNDYEIKEAYREDTVGRKIPSSIVTKKDIVGSKGENSECVTAEFNKPMTKRKFKYLSNKTKIAYITHLENTYGVLRRDIATMLGYTENTFSKICRDQLHMGSVRGGRKEQLKGEDLERWQRFLNGECPETTVPNELADGKLTLDDKEMLMVDEGVSKEPVAEYTPGLKTTKLCIEQVGEFYIEDLTMLIKLAIPKGTKCRVNLCIEGLEEGETA